MQPIPPAQPAGAVLLPVCPAGHLGADLLQSSALKGLRFLHMRPGERIESFHSRGSFLFHDADDEVKLSGYAARLAGSEEILRQQEAWTSSGKSAKEFTKTALGLTGLFQKNKTSQASAHIRTLIGR